MLRTFRTPKGTELPLLNLRGKEYLEVKFRLVWFREEHPAWRIETDVKGFDADQAYVCAFIKDENGNVMAMAHKMETKKGFPDFLEKAETGAIGRALALVGYGTQFCADELDEGDRIVDAPVETKQIHRPNGNGGVQSVSITVTKAEAVGDWVCPFGKKYKGQKLKDIPRAELEAYLEWLEESATKKGLPLSEEARFLKVQAERYFATLGAGPDLGFKDEAWTE